MPLAPEVLWASREAADHGDLPDVRDHPDPPDPADTLERRARWATASRALAARREAEDRKESLARPLENLIQNLVNNATLTRKLEANPESPVSRELAV